MKQTEGLLSLFVHRHLVLELAALLSEGAGSIMNPFVTVDLLTPAGAIGSGGRAGEDDGSRCDVGGGGDNVVDAVLLLAHSQSAYVKR